MQPPQHQPLGDQRNGADDQRRDHQRGEEAERRMAADGGGDRPGEHGAQHEELAMGDIDHAHDAEHQRQAKRRQRQHGGGDEAFEGGEEEVGSEGHSGCLARWQEPRNVISS